MNVVLWVVAGLLAAAFLGSGVLKLSQPKEKLAAAGMGWTDDFSASTVKTIGGLELLAAIGLILPGALGIAAVLVPLAAVGLALIMIAAVITHARRHELPFIAINVVLLALALVVIVGRFGPERFS
jgi:hypothetical protein